MNNTFNNPRLSRACAGLLALTAVTASATAGTFINSGSSITPDADDISHLVGSSNLYTGYKGEGTLNYFTDAGNGAGQTFTTGTNPLGYFLDSVSLRFSTEFSDLTLDTAPLVLDEADKLAVGILQPSSQYAFFIRENGGGYTPVDVQLPGGYMGGRAAVLTGDGTLIFDSSVTNGTANDPDANFNVGLTAVPEPTSTSLVVALAGAGMAIRQRRSR
jgi:hypothetical protein